MTNRRAFLQIGLGIAMTLAFATWPAALAAKPKKKPEGERVTPDNPDGVDTIDGAIWEFAAVRDGTGETKTYRFRVAEGVFYSALDEVVGTTRLKPGKKFVAILTFNEKTPVAGTYVVKCKRHGHWEGLQTIDDAKWAVRLTCIDR